MSTQDENEPVQLSLPGEGEQGRDEMNLAEFPFATLSRRGDNRQEIIHETWITDKNGNRLRQLWRVQGVNLPTEYDERVYVALMKITHEQGFAERKVPFSVYEILRLMGSRTGMREYQNVEDALNRLVAATIHAEGAFWDHARQEWIKTKTGFHIIDRYWLAYRETNEQIREAEGVPAYIVWGQDFWDSFKAGYVKNLDLDFFYSLRSALSRRLYRFLDKRIRYQADYEIDIFELAGRLGMARYAKPAQVRNKLQPAFDELIARGFLSSAEIVKRQVKRREYTRVHFTKGEGVPAGRNARQAELPVLTPGQQDEQIALRLRPMEDELWARALRQIEGSMTRATFNAWFPQTRLVALEDGVATIGVANEAAREWLANRLDRVIREALLAVGEEVRELKFEVNDPRP